MASPIKNFLFGGKGTATTLGDVGLAVVRLTFGLLLAFAHGMGKIYGEGRIGPSKGFIESVEGIGFPAPTLFAWAAALAEFLGALLIAAGLLTRPAALMIAFNMAIAAFVVHGGDPWYNPPGAPPDARSKEMALLYLAPAILLMLTGAGRISADYLIGGGKGGGSRPAPKKSD
jgi:putative oxidoreductase